MRVLLNLDGWEKEEEIPDRFANRGYVEIGLYWPLVSTLTEGLDALARDYLKVAMFTYYGNKKNGLHVFEYEP